MFKSFAAMDEKSVGNFLIILTGIINTVMNLISVLRHLGRMGGHANDDEQHPRRILWQFCAAVQRSCSFALASNRFRQPVSTA
jgi:hypothetical protein